MFNFSSSKESVRKLSNLVKINPDITDEDYIIKEINKFKNSIRRKQMVDGENYYNGKHDILKAKRMGIGENGDLIELENLPNNRIVDNQYKKMVDQKNNYLLGQPITFQCENEVYAKLIKKIFNKKFLRLMRNIGEDSLNEGIAWLYVYYDEKGVFSLKRFKGYEIIPGWKDAEHTILEYVIRIYEVIKVEKNQEKIIEKVEVYDEKGVYYFTLDENRLIPDNPKFKTHFSVIDHDGNIDGYNWTKIPIIPFKYNSKEIPLIKMVKSLQDGINKILSNFENNMEEDSRNTILVLVNYDGQNLGEFRKNLSQYGAVKIKTIDGAAGDLRTLQVEVNAENYKSILELFKKALIENAMGYDAKDDRLNGQPNQMNIQSMYSDIDLDANGMETEFQASFEELLWFINCHLFNIGLGDFESEEIDVIFNRDMLMNESEIIDNVNKSTEVISMETAIANHPWVDDPQKELERINKEKQENMEQYGNAFNPLNGGNTDDEDGDDNNEE